ncbi:MAG: hypothetical protein ABSF23_14370 [Terracidiphilus sp.]
MKSDGKELIARRISLTNLYILPSLNRCERCGKPESAHQKANHEYRRDGGIPEWHGWHAARRGLGSNLDRLVVPDMVIQRILRQANVSTPATYYIETAAADVRSAMTKLENHIAEAGKVQPDTNGRVDALLGANPTTIQ